MTSSENLKKLEEAKRRAAYACVEKHAKDGQIIGLGSGSTAVYVAKCLAEKYEKKLISDIVCVPTSSQARCLILEHGLPLGDLDVYPILDICIDGADEIDSELNCIKGGGACQTQEKLVMNSAKYFYVVADFRKRSTRLGEQWKYIPLEVLSRAWVALKVRIEASMGGRCELRMGKNKVGPVVTDNGGFVLDWYMPNGYDPSDGWDAVHRRLKLIPGVVETGIFVGFAQEAYFGMQDGSVSIITAPNDRRINPLDRT